MPASAVVRVGLPLQVGETASALVVSDVTGDGRIDIVVGTQRIAERLGRLVVLPGDGGGGFGLPVTLDVEGPVTGLVSADLAGDGIPRLVYSARSAGRTGAVGIASAAGGTPRREATLARGGSPQWVQALDVNRDGSVDVVVGHLFGARGAELYLNSGSRGFQWRARVLASQWSFCPPAWADFDSDRELDVVTTNFSVLTLARGDGVGRFGHAREIAAARDERPDQYFNCQFGVLDLDGDGRTDVLSTTVVGAVKWTLGVQRGDGNGHFTTRDVVWRDDLRNLGGLVIADVDRDHRDDLVIGTSGRSPLVRRSIGWLKGDGAGGFAARSDLWFTSAPGNVAVMAPSVGDFDSDGRLDAVALDGQRGPLVIVSDLADVSAVGSLSAPKHLDIERPMHVSFSLRTPCSVTIKLRDRDGASSVLRRIELAAGDHRMRLRLPRELRRGRYALSVRGLGRGVATTRERPLILE